MKYIFPILLSSLILLACSDAKPTDHSSTTETSATDSLKQSFLEEQKKEQEKWAQNLKGSWYNQDYFDHLKNFRSPFQLFGEAPAIIGFTVDKKVVFSDKNLYFPAVNIHEGGYRVHFILKENQLYFSNNSDSKKLYKVVAIRQDELLFEDLQSNQIFSFVRKDDFGEAVSAFMMEGTYQILETGQTVQFGGKENIVGWSEYNTYTVPFDYVGLPEFDLIFLGKKPVKNLDGYTMYKASFGTNEVVLIKYLADWEKMEFQETSDRIHLRKK